MKNLLCFTALFHALFAFSMNIKVLKSPSEIKVVEVQITTNCEEISDLDPETDASYNCHINKVKNTLTKEFGKITKIDGLNAISKDVISNSVENEGTYITNLRVHYYQ